MYRLTSLSQLPLLPHLHALYVQEDNISVISPIHGAPLLQILNLAFNKVNFLERKSIPLLSSPIPCLCYVAPGSWQPLGCFVQVHS